MDPTTTIATTTAATSAAVTMPSNVGTAIGFVVQNVVDVLGLITANPVLCLGIAMWCAGGAIGLFKRLV